MILSDQIAVDDFPLAPMVQKIFIRASKENTMNNQADVDHLRQELSRAVGGRVEIPLDLMAKISRICRQSDWQVSATLAAGSFFDDRGQVDTWRLMDIEAGQGSGRNLGLAVDIGTTTVVVYLVDLENGKIIATAADYNGQMAMGEDILTRIMAAGLDGGLEKLQSLIVATLNQLITAACRQAGEEPLAVNAISIGANTTMIHLLLGLDPAAICRSPYIPLVNDPGIFSAREIGLAINPLAAVYCLPSVGSYIGGDIIAGILVSGMDQQAETSLFVDIGTNGEIVIGNQDWLVACAGAAGPALEGGVSQWGMRAEPGAIDSVAIDGQQRVSCTTIGQAPARGICGSGLIDCLAELFLTGIIDRKAKFTIGRDRFVLVPADQTADGQEIFVSQVDIDNLMRTKGAVNTALEVLIEGVGCQWSSIGRFYAAGAFGQYLHIESAVTIGLYPDLPREKMIRLGNSSGEGARQVLLSNGKRLAAEKIAAKITYFEMNASATFMEKYAGSKFLPHTNLDFYPSVKLKLSQRSRGQ